MCPHRWIPIALVTATAISTTASAQQPRTAEQQLLATDDQRMDALRRSDPMPLERIYADDRPDQAEGHDHPGWPADNRGRRTGHEGLQERRGPVACHCDSCDADTLTM